MTEKVTFTYTGGRTSDMHPKHADVLHRLGRGTYETAAIGAESLARKPMVARKQSAEVSASDDASDGLDALDQPALLELAKARDIAVHHRAGADKIRTALRAGAAA